MKLVDRLTLSSVNMATKLNFNNLLKRINEIVDDLTKGTGVVKSFAGREGVVLPKATDYDNYYVETVAGRRGDVTLDASDIETGTLDVARGGTGADLTATGGTMANGPATARAYVRQETTGGNVTVGFISADDVAGGRVQVSRGGTGSDLSATGGAGQVLKQVTVGGEVTVGTLAFTDLTGTSNVIEQGDTITSAQIDSANLSGTEPTWTDVSNTIRTKCYLRAKAAGASDVFGVFVPHKLKLGGTTYNRSTVSESTTNCSISTKTCDEYGILFEITSTAAGDCYATGVYDVRPNPA